MRVDCCLESSSSMSKALSMRDRASSNEAFRAVLAAEIVFSQDMETSKKFEYLNRLVQKNKIFKSCCLKQSLVKKSETNGIDSGWSSRRFDF